MNFRRLIFLAILAVVSASASAGKKIQCWTDDEGRRMCGDSVPPAYLNRERNVIDAQGRVVETKPRPPTQAEIAEMEKKKAEEAEQARRAERQHAYDRYLMESYQSVHDLEATRDQRLQALEVRMELVQKAIASGQQTLDGLIARRSELQKQGKPVDKALEAQLKEARRYSIENPKALAQLKIEHEKISAQFAADIARYELLKQAQAAQVPPPPTP